MGTDYYAYAVIGCEVTGKLHEIIEERGCRCEPAPVAGAKFCSLCGKIAMITVGRPKSFYDPENDRIAVANAGPMPTDIRVRSTTDGIRSFAGIATTGVDYYSRDGACCAPASAEMIASAAATVKSVLEPLGLWDPTTFGLWAVLHCSY